MESAKLDSSWSAGQERKCWWKFIYLSLFIFFHSSIFCGYCLKKVSCHLIICRLLYGLLLMRTVARVTCCFKRWQAITNDKKWQIKDNQCWSTTSARKTVGESFALCQSVDKQRWKVATETNMTYKGGMWQRRKIWQTKEEQQQQQQQKQIWQIWQTKVEGGNGEQRCKVAIETNMTKKTDSSMNWDNMV